MTSEPPTYADRCYRSGAALAGGVLLLALAAWLGGDAMIRGEGRTPVVAAAAMLFAVPLVVAFTLRPAVYAGPERLRIRNPFRTVTLPWATVDTVRAGYSSEVIADGKKYQLWAIPVSLRDRKKAQRHNERLASGRPGGQPMRGLLGMRHIEDSATERKAPSDEAVAELRELAERHADSTGTPSARWAYEILAPLVVGGIALVVILASVRG
ncbi:PH domain-containing protein [Streptomyces gobiensis]|uniref:PH domain-containing protein n=1 Tax=Streptomyces gobiensis TaxID=2875706 RepID=UPI001E5022BF|nr:PH domain-containing protein [Streptomyces gobiensis]UGY93299.1 PH domain-containing protein [Streptomyces gobiensis]